MLIQGDPGTESALRVDSVQRTGQGYPWLRGGMASSSSVAGAEGGWDTGLGEWQ